MSNRFEVLREKTIDLRNAAVVGAVATVATLGPNVLRKAVVDRIYKDEE